MANLRKPSSSSPNPAPGSQPGTPGADDDISLDHYEERAQAKPRLPERHERMAAEMTGAQPAQAPERVKPDPAADPFDSNPAARAATDDIADYDPAADRPAPSLKKKSQPAADPAPAAESPAREGPSGLDDLEEFIARTASQAPPSDQPAREKKPLTMLEKVSFGVGGALLLGIVIFFFRAAASEATPAPKGSDGWPDLPMKGSIVTISEASSNWRRRTESDRVGQMEITLPSPGMKEPEIIPEVTFSIDGGASSDGYVRFLFKDSEGKPQGDTRVIGIKGGKLVDLGKGEIIKSGTEASIYASYGMVDIHAWNSYTGNNQPRWSVEVGESSSYDARDQDWKVLGIFDVRNDLTK